MRLIDKSARIVNNLRLSLSTESVLQPIYHPKKEDVVGRMMSDDEVRYLVKLLGEMDVHRVRVTGGEALLRKNIIPLLSDLRNLNQMETLTLTTDGAYLKYFAKDLADIGIDGVNVSLNSMDADVFETMAGKDALLDVLDGLNDAVKYKIPNIKINAVILRGINEDDIIPLAYLAKENQITVRFIEAFSQENMDILSAREIKARLTQKFGRVRRSQRVLGDGPADYFHFDGFESEVGFVSVFGDRACEGCNRIFLTADGRLKECFYGAGVSLLEMVEQGESEKSMMRSVKNLVYQKPRKPKLLRKWEKK